MADPTFDPGKISTTKKPTWAVIGGGNGGQSLSGHLALMGFPVRLYDIFADTIEAIASQGGIHLDGAVQGFGPLELATVNLADALDGAHIVAIVAPAVAHRSIARDCAPHLSDGQIVFVHPGATAGALEFRKVLADHGCRCHLTIAESNSLIYACRSPRPGHASILGIKKELMVAALPASENPNVVALLNSAFPQIYAGVNVLQTSLANPNAMMHPAPTLLNTSMIESDRDWLYYLDGITPSIGDFVEKMDRERLALARAFGLKLPSILKWYELAYGVSGATLSEAVKKNEAYQGVQGQTTLHTRYLLEDIPTGLVPMASLGKHLGIDVPRMELVIKLGEYLTGEDLTSRGRTLENLGLAGMSISEIKTLIDN